MASATKYNHVLVTGGAGFIGSHLCEKLLAMKLKVTAIDNFDNYYNPILKHNNILNIFNHKNFTMHRIDIRDEEKMLDTITRSKPDMVIHLAARPGVRASLENPQVCMDINVRGSAVVLDICRKLKIDKVILASSSSVYGKNNKVPFAEDDNVAQPMSPYAASKAAMELLSYTFHLIYDMKIANLRFFTVYGPRQRPEMAIMKFLNAIKANETIPQFGDGSTKRDYTYIDDIIDGILKTIETEYRYEIFNLGNENPVTLKDLLNIMETTTKKKLQLDLQPLQPGDMTVTYADLTKSRKLLGYAPQVTLDEGISRTWKWVQKQ